MSEKTRSRLTTFWQEWARPILIAVVLLCTFRSAVADWNDVPSSSMRPTILEGDRIFIDKTAFDWRVPFLGWSLSRRADPERGDVVIFPSPDDGRRLVKRVVGIPGDTIELRQGRLWVDGRQAAYGRVPADWLPGLAEGADQGYILSSETVEKVAHPIMTLDQPMHPSYGPIVVPDGQYFMMGDNRDNSHDSRFFGTVPRDVIMGRALAVALSVDPDNHYLPRWQRFFSKLP
ncbi:MAG: signal peptidase I [Planctomycetota bacterium]